MLPLCSPAYEWTAGAKVEIHHGPGALSKRLKSLCFVRRIGVSLGPGSLPSLTLSRFSRFYGVDGTFEETHENRGFLAVCPTCSFAFEPVNMPILYIGRLLGASLRSRLFVEFC